MVIGVGNRDIVAAASVLVLVSRQYFHCLGLEGQCLGLGLGLGTYCLGPITATKSLTLSDTYRVWCLKLLETHHLKRMQPSGSLYFHP